VNSTTTWSAVGAGLDDLVFAVSPGLDGSIYASGFFHNVSGGGIAVAHIAKWTAAGAWAAMGAGLDAVAYHVIAAPNGDVYAGGVFHNADGAGANHVAKWNGTAWSALGAGVDDLINMLAIAPNGDLYAGGAFHNAGIVAANHIAKWNGISWSALGSGTNDGVGALHIGDSGDLYVGGSFTSAGGHGVSCWAIWANGVWLPGGVGSLNNQVTAFDFTSTRAILAGLFTAATTPGVTEITTTCSARAYPTIAITGPGRLLYLINYTTGQVIYFDITLVASEVLTIDLRPGYKTVTSSFRGNLISGVLAGSLVTWYLTPGLNHIGCYVDNVLAAGSYGYTPVYWGAS
jgi:hypothetical protein